MERHDIAAHFHCHDDFFQSGVPSAFAKAVDRALYLTGTTGDCSQCIGCRHTQIIMAMGGKHHLVGARNSIDQHGDQLCRLYRRRIADRVGNVDRRCPRFDRNLDHPAQIILFGTGRIHW